MMFGLDQYGAATFDRRPGRAPIRTLGTCEARLTLQSGTACPTTDQTGKSTVYLTPHHGCKVELYDTTVNQWVARDLTAEISVAVPSTLFRLFDLFAYWTGSAIALEATNWNQTTGSITGATAANPCVVTSVAHGQSNSSLVGIDGITGTLGTNANNGLNDKVFTLANVAADTFECQGSDTSGLAYTANGTWYLIPNTRATALTTQNGRYVKTGDASRLYVGTGMTHGTSGQTEDSVSRRLLWNNFNRRLVPMRVTDSTNTWDYTSSIRPANNLIANRVEFVQGLSEDAVFSRIRNLFYSDSALFPTVSTGIGLDRTSAFDSQTHGGFGCSVATLPQVAEWEGHPGIGYHYLQRLEYSDAVGTTTWYGDSGAAQVIQTGMFALVWC